MNREQIKRLLTSRIVDNDATGRRELVAIDGEVLAFISIELLFARHQLPSELYWIDTVKPWGFYSIPLASPPSVA